MKRESRLIILALLCYGFWPLSGLADSPETYTFDHLAYEEGLTQATVHNVFQDSKGFIWIGSFDGLNRFDGKKFVVYKNDPDNPEGLSNGLILDIFESSDGYLWIGTHGGGLNRFDRYKDSFRHYKHHKGDQNSISDNRAMDIYEDVHRNLWIATEKGLNQKAYGSDNFTRYRHNPNDSSSLNSDFIKVIAGRKDGYLWIGTDRGLNRFNIKTGCVEPYLNPSDIDHAIEDSVSALYFDDRDGLWIGTHHMGLCYLDLRQRKLQCRMLVPKRKPTPISSILADEKGQLWVATKGDGIYVIDDRLNRISQIKSSVYKKNALSSDYISSLYRDRSGLIWAATKHNGVSIYDPRRTQFSKREILSGTGKDKINQVIWGFWEESEGIVWIVAGNGLARYDRTDDRYSYHLLTKGTGKDKSEIGITAIISDSKGTCWLATTDGIYQLHPDTKRFQKFWLPDKRFGRNGDLTSKGVRGLIEDRYGNLWFSINGIGIFKLNRERSRIRSFLYQADGKGDFACDHFYSIKPTHNGDVWIGTLNGGLYRYDPERDQFLHYRNRPGDQNSINSDSVISIHPGTKGLVWLGTTRGFCSLDPVNNRVQRYTKKEGYLDDPVYEIIEDDLGYLWIAGSRLTRYDPKKNRYIFFTTRDGLQGGEFNTRAVLKSRYHKNLFYFGGGAGFNMIDVNDIKRNTFAPPIYLTQLKINGKVIDSGHCKIRPASILESANLQLPHESNNLMLEFIALNYSDPGSNTYAYKIDGINEDWIHLGNSNELVLTNLHPGDYRIQIRGANSEGIWSQRNYEMNLTIKPPFWMTGWFRLLMLSVFLSSFFILYRKGMRRLERKYRKKNMIDQLLKKYNISKREKEVIDLIVAGKTSREIEDKLFISLSTVNNHIFNILKKMKLKKRGELIVLFKTLTY